MSEKDPNKNKPTDLSRRGFLKGAGAAVGIAATGLPMTSAAPVVEATIPKVMPMVSDKDLGFFKSMFFNSFQDTRKIIFNPEDGYNLDYLKSIKDLLDFLRFFPQNFPISMLIKIGKIEMPNLINPRDTETEDIITNAINSTNKVLNEIVEDQMKLGNFTVSQIESWYRDRVVDLASNNPLDFKKIFKIKFRLNSIEGGANSFNVESMTLWLKDYIVSRYIESILEKKEGWKLKVFEDYTGSGPKDNIARFVLDIPDVKLLEKFQEFLKSQESEGAKI